MEQLTVKEALAQGYTYCCPQYDEGYYKIEGMQFRKGVKYMLASKGPIPYTISDKVVRDLVDDYFCSQDDVYDENGKMNDLIAENVDFSDITNQINKAIESVKFYFPTAIQLIP